MIRGKNLVKSTSVPPCNNCPPDERRVRLIIKDPTTNLGGTITLKLTTVNGQPTLEGLIFGHAPYLILEDNPPQHTQMVVPTGDFIFIKQ